MYRFLEDSLFIERGRLAEPIANRPCNAPNIATTGAMRLIFRFLFEIVWCVPHRMGQVHSLSGDS
jgi:hypothetical protein